METNNDLEKFLSDNMSADHLNFSAPDRLLLDKARKKVLARAEKNPMEEKQGVIYMIAYFLNFRVKLYQAVAVTVIIGGLIFYFTRDKKNNKNEVQQTEYVSNLASTKSSTVMSCTKTFGLNKKQLYGRTID